MAKHGGHAPCIHAFPWMRRQASPQSPRFPSNVLRWRRWKPACGVAIRAASASVEWCRLRLRCRHWPRPQPSLPQTTAAITTYPKTAATTRMPGGLKNEASQLAEGEGDERDDQKSCHLKGGAGIFRLLATCTGIGIVHGYTSLHVQNSFSDPACSGRRDRGRCLLRLVQPEPFQVLARNCNFAR